MLLDKYERWIYNEGKSDKYTQEDTGIKGEYNKYTSENSNFSILTLEVN